MAQRASIQARKSSLHGIKPAKLIDTPSSGTSMPLIHKADPDLVSSASKSIGQS